MPPEETDQDSGMPQDTGGFSPVTDEEINAAVAAEAGEEPPGEPEPSTEPAPEPFIEVDGRRWTPEEIRKGLLLQEDYSRNKNKLREEQDRLEQERQELERRRNVRSNSDDLDITDEPESLEDRVNRLEAERQAEAQTRHAEQADQLYWKAVDDMLGGKEVQEDLKRLGIEPATYREMVDRMMLSYNPDTANLKAFEGSIRELFPTIHKQMVQLISGAVETRLGAIRKTKAIPTTKAAGAVPATPSGEQKPRKSFEDPVTAEELAEAGA